jgi:hypothetical protein
MVMWKYFFAVLAILLAGCGGSHSVGAKPAIRVSSATDIRDALGKAGLNCTGYQSVARKDPQVGAESAADVGECDLEDESDEIQIIVWKDTGKKDNWLGMGNKTGCQIGQVFGFSSFDYVDGGLWTIAGVSQTVAKKISDAIGGKPVHHNCGRLAVILSQPQGCRGGDVHLGGRRATKATGPV